MGIEIVVGEVAVGEVVTGEITPYFTLYKGKFSIQKIYFHKYCIVNPLVIPLMHFCCYAFRKQWRKFQAIKPTIYLSNK